MVKPFPRELNTDPNYGRSVQKYIKPGWWGVRDTCDWLGISVPLFFRMKRQYRERFGLTLGRIRRLTIPVGVTHHRYAHGWRAKWWEGNARDMKILLDLLIERRLRSHRRRSLQGQRQMASMRGTVPVARVASPYEIKIRRRLGRDARSRRSRTPSSGSLPTRSTSSATPRKPPKRSTTDSTRSGPSAP